MLTKFRHLLVPLDFTTKDEVALEIALELARQNKASVTLLHVIEMIENLEDADLTAFYTRLAARAETKLGLWCKSLPARESASNANSSTASV